MALTLTRGTEARTDGAPFIPVNMRDEYLRARTRELMAQNPDLDEIAAAMQAEAEMNEAAAARQQRDATTAQRYGERQAERSRARGFGPEALPPGEYGAASGRAVQEANRPLADAEAALAIEQDTADAIARGLREGRPDWRAEGQRAYLQERGERNPNAPVGQRDIDYRDRFFRERGQMVEMPDGSLIPVGPDPTAAQLRSLREWDEWRNETPGSERQAIYDPQSYEQFREEARTRLRDQAQQDAERYGTGATDPAVRADLGLPGLTPEQQAARGARTRSEDRQAEAEREVRIARLARRAGVTMEAARRMMDEGRQAARPPAGDGEAANDAPLTVAERRVESQGLRDLGTDRRNADLNERRDLLRERGRLRGAGLSPAVGDMRNRFDELIARLGDQSLTDWQRAGIIAGITPNAETANPTPLGVDAVGAQNTLRMIQGMGLGEGFLTNPAVQHQIQQGRLQQQADVLQDAEGYVNDNFAWDSGWFGASTYDAREQQQTIDYLMAKYGPPNGDMTLAQAQDIVDVIAAKKRPEVAGQARPDGQQPAAGWRAPAPPQEGLPPAGGRMPL